MPTPFGHIAWFSYHNPNWLCDFNANIQSMEAELCIITNGISMRDKYVYIYNHTGILSKSRLDVYQNFGQIARVGLGRVIVTNQ